MKRKRYIIECLFLNETRFLSFTSPKLYAYSYQYDINYATVVTEKQLTHNICSALESVLVDTNVCEIDKDRNILKKIPINGIQRYFKLQYL